MSIAYLRLKDVACEILITFYRLETLFERKMQEVKKMDLDTLNPSQLIDEFANHQPLPELYNVIATM